MIELILKLLMYLIGKNNQISADTKRIFYDFYEKYSSEHSNDNAKEKINTEDQIKDLNKKN